MACTSSSSPRVGRPSSITRERTCARAVSTGGGVRASIQPSTREDATAGAITGTPAATTDWPTISSTRAVAAAPASAPRPRSRTLSLTASTPRRTARPIAEPIAAHATTMPIARAAETTDRHSASGTIEISSGPASGTSHAARNPPSTRPAIVPSEATRPRAAPTTIATTRATTTTASITSTGASFPHQCRSPCYEPAAQRA